MKKFLSATICLAMLSMSTSCLLNPPADDDDDFVVPGGDTEVDLTKFVGSQLDFEITWNDFDETAIDEMLSSTAFWAGIEFEKGVLADGEPQRNAGMLLILVSLVFLGIALFSSLIHIKSNRVIWLLGLVVLFAGVYVLYSADGVSFWIESVVTSTVVQGASMMLYMLFLFLISVSVLHRTKRAGSIAAVLLAAADAVAAAAETHFPGQPGDDRGGRAWPCRLLRKGGEDNGMQ